MVAVDLKIEKKNKQQKLFFRVIRLVKKSEIPLLCVTIHREKLFFFSRSFFGSEEIKMEENNKKQTDGRYTICRME